MPYTAGIISSQYYRSDCDEESYTCITHNHCACTEECSLAHTAFHVHIITVQGLSSPVCMCIALGLQRGRMVIADYLKV